MMFTGRILLTVIPIVSTVSSANLVPIDVSHADKPGFSPRPVLPVASPPPVPVVAPPAEAKEATELASLVYRRYRTRGRYPDTALMSSLPLRTAWQGRCVTRDIADSARGHWSVHEVKYSSLKHEKEVAGLRRRVIGEKFSYSGLPLEFDRQTGTLSFQRSQFYGSDRKAVEIKQAFIRVGRTKKGETQLVLVERGIRAKLTRETERPSLDPNNVAKIEGNVETACLLTPMAPLRTNASLPDRSRPQTERIDVPRNPVDQLIVRPPAPNGQIPITPATMP